MALFLAVPTVVKKFPPFAVFAAPAVAKKIFAFRRVRRG
jgi:hypothetical protein